MLLTNMKVHLIVLVKITEYLTKEHVPQNDVRNNHPRFGNFLKKERCRKMFLPFLSFFVFLRLFFGGASLCFSCFLRGFFTFWGGGGGSSLFPLTRRLLRTLLRSASVKEPFLEPFLLHGHQAIPTLSMRASTLPRGIPISQTKTSDLYQKKKKRDVHNPKVAKASAPFRGQNRQNREKRVSGSKNSYFPVAQKWAL